MSELIDRDAVREFIKSYSHSTDVVYHMEKQLYEVPTIDAVPVVRCGECKWYGIYYAKKDGTPDKRYKPSVCLRGKYAKRRDQDWFCADGERRRT